jgi:transcriptional regulator with PAS, ATPase and Fis domain
MKDAWRLFIQKGILKRDIIPDRVVYSWVRCRLKNLEPQGTGLKISLRQDAEMIQRSQLPAILTIQNKIKAFYTETPYYFITLKHLVLYSSDSFDDWIFEGIEFSEEYHGTNSLDLAMESLQYEVIMGHEHYKTRLHASVTASFPTDIEDLYVTLIFPLNQYDDVHDDFQNFSNQLQTIGVDATSHKLQPFSSVDKEFYDLVAEKSAEAAVSFNPFICIYKHHGSYMEPLAKESEHAFYQLETSVPFIEKTEAALNGGLKTLLYMFEEEPILVQFQRIDCSRYVGVSHLDSMVIAANQWSGNRSLYALEDIQGKSDAIRMTLFNAQKAASHDAPFLIIGERGTGKSALAQGIHHGSKRSNGPFIAIDCEATPLRALESMIFGDLEKNTLGALTLVKGGTLYIDHIEALPNPLQKRLLKVMDFDSEASQDTVRFIFSSRNDLKIYVQQGIIREDLHHRIGLFTLQIPALRERKADIKDLALWLIKELSTLYHMPIPLVDDGFFEVLSQLQWLGNARELQQTLQEILIHHRHTPILKAAHLSQKLNLKQTLDSGQRFNLEELEKEVIKAAIEESKSNISKASELLGIGRTTLYRKLEKYEILV